MANDNINLLFIQDCQEKKKIGRNIKARASRKGNKGKIMFYSDIIKGKKKKEYIKSSEIISWNMYDDLNNLSNFKRFQQINSSERKFVLYKYLEKHSVQSIAQHWNITTKECKKIIKELEVIRNMTTEKITKEDVPTYENFKLLDKEQRKEKLILYLNNFTKKELAEIWNVRPNVIYDTVRLLGLSSMFNAQQRGGNRPKNDSKSNKTLVVSEHKEEKVIKQPPVDDNLTFYTQLQKPSFNLATGGNLTGEELGDELMRIASSIRKNGKFNYKLLLTEFYEE